MKPARVLLLAIACSLPLVASAQWMWVDKDGRKVMSDQAPPPEVPAKNILRQPGVRKTDPTPAATAPATPELAKPVLATAKSGKDKELEDKKKAAESAEAEKQKARDQEVQKARADNCERAKRAKGPFDNGARIARTNEKGEREFLDDSARAAEAKRIDAVIARDCTPAG